MVGKKGLMFVIFFIFIFMNVSVLGEANTKNTEVMTGVNVFSRYLLDTKSIEINELIYTALLYEDYLYIANEEGEVVKQIQYLHNYQTISDYMSLKDFDYQDITLEIIDDIDNKGINDFMIIITDHLINDVSTLISISYEDEQILWEYTPQMLSSLIKDRNDNYKLDVPITSYHLNEYLYITAGYKIEKLDIKTGQVIDSYEYKNNIWDMELISDFNNNGSLDIAISVQPSKVIYIDGNTFKKIGEIEVSKDLILYSENEIFKTNVWSITYLHSRNILVAGSEDGYVYEISLTENKIISQEKLFNINIYKSRYDEVIKSQNVKYETYQDGEKTYYYVGKGTVKYTMMKVYKTASYDTDELEDYVVEFIPYWGDNPTFIQCSSISKCEIVKIQNKILSHVNDNIIVYKDEEFNTIIKDITTNQILLSSSHNVFSTINRNSSLIIHFQLFEVDDGYIIQYNYQFIVKIKKDELDKIDWILTMIEKQTSEKTDDRLLVFNQVNKYDTSFSVYDENMSLIIDEHLKFEKIINHNIKDNQLYITKVDILNEQNSTLQIYDISQGILVASSHFYQTFHQLYPLDLILSQTEEMYADVNGDGFYEMLIKVLFDQNGVRKYRYLIYDIKNDQVLKHQEVAQISNFSKSLLYNDINQDGIPEVMTYQASGGKTDFQIYLSNEESFFNEDQKITIEFNANLMQYKLMMMEDLNQDGYDELIFTQYTPEINSAYLFDLKNNQSMIYENSFDSQGIFQIVRVEDINNDGIKELFIIDVIEDPLTTSFPVRLKVMTYEQNTFKELFHINLNLSEPVYPLTDLSTLFVLKEMTGDNIKDLVLYAIDESNNSSIEVIDLSSYQLVETQTQNDLTNKQANQLNQDTKTYQNIHLIQYQNKNYFKVQPNIDSKLFNALIDTTTFKRDSFVGTNFLDTFQDKWLFLDNKQIKWSEPVKQDEIQINIGGFFKNIYQLSIKNNNISSIEIIHKDIIYYTIKDNHFKRSLPNGEYEFIYCIKTNDGGLYYDYDVFVIENNLIQKIIYLSSILIITTTIFIINRSVIYKKYWYK